MARYNTAPQTLEVTGEQTFTYHLPEELFL